MVYTGMDAPEWIYSNGVPKVMETASDGRSDTYSPYYLDPEYNTYFKRMITKVRQHIESLSLDVRSKIIGIQACFGSTGDQIDYKGEVAPEYAIPDAQLDSLFKVYSTYYYNEYKNVTPKIPILSNPWFKDSTQLYWLLENCPGGWIKCGTIGKGSQLNFELDKNQWLYNVLNKPVAGSYIQARCEIVGSHLYSGWWANNPYKEMFSLLAYCIYWGLDWPNQKPDFIKNNNYDSAYAFFNKYAGQKVAATATNAVSVLKDALDASDSVRFPASSYGIVDRYNVARYKNIRNSFIAYGAKLEDESALTGSEYAKLGASGTNDVGWRLLPGNYERFLHQIDANITSAGYWNVDDNNTNAMFGRFARGFDVAKNKNALYFDVANDFFRNKPLNGAYPVTVEVTYYDEGDGSWKLFYDADNNSNKASVQVNCTNTKTWKKVSFVLNDAIFGNGSERNADFYIKNTGSSNVIFSVVELSRQQQPDAGLMVTSVKPFDSVCFKGNASAQSFALNGAGLAGEDIQVGPFRGFTFSTTENGKYTDSLIYSNYGQALNEVIYVKLNTDMTGNFSGYIPVKMNGVNKEAVQVSGTVLNTSPLLNADVSMVSCFNMKDGVIDLQPQGGTGPFSYQWKTDIMQFWVKDSEDISSLQPANYTVNVTSALGCVATKTFQVTQPDKLEVSVSQDSAMFCKNTSTTVTVTATGGNLPYEGTGPVVAGPGFKIYYVTDARGCAAQKGLTVANGTVTIPAKPVIEGVTKTTQRQSNLVFNITAPNEDYVYKWTVPADAEIVSGQNSPSITVNWGTATGNITATAINSCGTSAAANKKVNISLSALTETGASDMAMVAPSAGVANKNLVLLPNPVSSIATLSFYAENRYEYAIRITDINGRIVLMQKGVALPSSNQVKLDVSRFAAGAYFISLVTNTGEMKTVKMIKQ